MNYGAHIRFLEREIATLGRAPFALDFRSCLTALARHVAPEGDAACRTFAATLVWPPMTEDVRFEVCARLACAAAWCTNLQDEESEETHGREFLESLLIEYWQDGGRTDWLRDVLTAHNPP